MIGGGLGSTRSKGERDDPGRVDPPAHALLMPREPLMVEFLARLGVLRGLPAGDRWRRQAFSEYAETLPLAGSSANSFDCVIFDTPVRNIAYPPEFGGSHGTTRHHRARRPRYRSLSGGSGDSPRFHIHCDVLVGTRSSGPRRDVAVRLRSPAWNSRIPSP
jgi:hypothetical protein